MNQCANSWTADCVEVLQYVEQIQGPPGPPGPTGARWLNGSGAPTPGLGLDGQVYYDIDTGNVYTKAAGTWVLDFSISPAREYLHNQISLSDIWTIPHNLARRPLVGITSVGGVEWFGGEVVHLSANTLQILFDQPTSGVARCI